MTWDERSKKMELSTFDKSELSKFRSENSPRTVGELKEGSYLVRHKSGWHGDSGGHVAAAMKRRLR